MGISHQVSCPHAHQQNGAAERKHRHIVEVGLTLLAHASMPLKFWDEAFLTAVFLINRLPSKVIHHDTPLFALLGAPAGQISAPITLESLSLDRNSVYSLVIVITIKALSVLNHPLVLSMYQEMSFFMRMCSLLPNCILMRAHNSEPSSRCYPIYFLAQTLALGKHKCMILVCLLHYLQTVYQV